VRSLRQLQTGRYVAVAAGVVTIAVVALILSRRGASGGGPDAGGKDLTPDALTATYSGLCTSRALVETDLDAARDVFYSRSHGTLHLMASELAKTDRPLTAELLEAKNQVEQQLRGVVPQTAAAALDRLMSISKEALISLGMTSPSCHTQAA
jgi:hypothetical protein